MYDTIIIGAGIAGLTSSMYLRRANKKVLILEGKCYGGQIINSAEVENYPGLPKLTGYEFAKKIYDQAMTFKPEIKYETVLKIENGNIKKVITNNNTYECRSIIIATGVKKRQLGIENTFIGKGVSYCATCDGAFYKNKTVALIGGGNTALEDANYLANICKKLYVIVRSDSFRGEEYLSKELLSNKNVEILFNTSIAKLQGNDRLESIELSNGEYLKTDGLFIAIGQIPDNTCFSDIISVNKRGYIITNEDCKTNIDGIYAIGDCREKKVRQLVTAASDGAIASMEAINYIRKEN